MTTYSPNTSHLHAATSPGQEARRRRHLDAAACLSLSAELLEIEIDAISGIRTPRARFQVECMSDRAARFRREAAEHLTAAARLTDWRDELDRKDGSWLSRLAHLVSIGDEAAPPRGHREQCLSRLDAFTRH